MVLKKYLLLSSHSTNSICGDLRTITRETVAKITDIIKKTHYAKIQICKPNKGNLFYLQKQSKSKQKKTKQTYKNLKHTEKIPLNQVKSCNAFTYPVFPGTYLLDKAKNLCQSEHLQLRIAPGLMGGEICCLNRS